MFEKLKKAMKVYKDLQELDFTYDTSRDSLDGLPYTLAHPKGLYTIWTANGFWFIELWSVGGKIVNIQYNISKFGSIGKIIVWFGCQRHISKWKTERENIKTSHDKYLIDTVMEK